MLAAGGASLFDRRFTGAVLRLQQKIGIGIGIGVERCYGFFDPDSDTDPDPEEELWFGNYVLDTIASHSPARRAERKIAPGAGRSKKWL